MFRSVKPAVAGALLLVGVLAWNEAEAIEKVGDFTDAEIASIASVKNVGLLKSVTVTGKGSVGDVINLDEVQAAAAKEVREYFPTMRFLDCGSAAATQDPAGNRTPIDCSKRVEDGLAIAFRVWTVGDKNYPIAFHLKVDVTMMPAGSDTPQLVVGAEKLGYTKKNRVQGIVESYIEDFLNHLALQLALARKGEAPTGN